MTRIVVMLVVLTVPFLTLASYAATPSMCPPGQLRCCSTVDWNCSYSGCNCTNSSACPPCYDPKTEICCGWCNQVTPGCCYHGPDSLPAICDKTTEFCAQAWTFEYNNECCPLLGGHGHQCIGQRYVACYDDRVQRCCTSAIEAEGPTLCWANQTCCNSEVPPYETACCASDGVCCGGYTSSHAWCCNSGQTCGEPYTCNNSTHTL